MKKISIIVMAVILVSSMIPGIYAGDTADADAKTRAEIECMGNYIGAAIRLLQLDRAIDKNILLGDGVVDFLQTLEYNTTDLEAILVEFKLLLAEVQAADPNASDAVQVFVDLKSNAIELSKEFRDTIHILVDEGTKETLRARFGEMTSEQIQNLSNMIKNKIRQYNKNQLYRLKDFLGETNESVFDKYQQGNITWTQLKDKIRSFTKNMTQEHRSELFGELKESRIRSHIQTRLYLDNVSEGFQIRKEARLTHRLYQGQNMTEGSLRAAFEYRIMNQMHQNAESGESGSGNGNGNSGAGDQQHGNDDSNTNNASDDSSGKGDGYGGSQGPSGGGQL